MPGTSPRRPWRAGRPWSSPAAAGSPPVAWRHTRRLFKLHSRKAVWRAGGDGLRAHITPPPARDNPFDWEAAAEAAARGPRGAAGAGPHEHWEQERQLPKGRYPAANRDLPVGGGVRAGAVALGVLQSLREHGIVQQARYLVSVSGGGFTAGALQRTLAAGRLEAPYGAESRPVPAAEVYAPGSVEEDHTRRHSDYLADTPRQWAVALDGLLLRLTCSLALLALASACLGLVLRGFCSASRLVRGGAVTVPRGGGTPRPTAVANLDALRPRFLAPCQEALQFRYCHVGPAVLHPRPGILLDLGALLALTAMSSWLGLRWRGLRHGFAQRVLVAAAVVAVFGAALPMAMWLGAWLTWQIGHATAGTETAVVSGSVGAACAGTLAATLWRNKTKVAKDAGGFLKMFATTVSGIVPNSMAQLFALWISLLAQLFSALLMVAGWVATGGP